MGVLDISPDAWKRTADGATRALVDPCDAKNHLPDCGFSYIEDWLLAWNIFIFHNVWDVILPIDFHIFSYFSRWLKPPTRGIQWTFKSFNGIIWDMIVDSLKSLHLGLSLGQNMWRLEEFVLLIPKVPDCQCERVHMAVGSLRNVLHHTAGLNFFIH